MSKYELKGEVDFEAVKNETAAYYHSIGEVYCPYLKEKISFNSRGWEHLRFRSHMQARTAADQYARFKLLPLAPRIIGYSGTLQGYDSTNHFERKRINNRTETLLLAVIYYQFTAVLDSVRVKIVIKRIEDGPPFFWSIIPFWKYRKSASSQHYRKLYDGDPETE